MPQTSATKAVSAITNALRASTRRKPPKASTVSCARTSAPSHAASAATMANATRLSRSSAARSRNGQQARPVSKGTSTRSVRSMRRSLRSGSSWRPLRTPGQLWIQTPNSFLRRFRCFRALPHRQRAPGAWFTGEIRRPRRAGRSEAKLRRVATHFVYPELLLSFGRPVEHFVIDGFGLPGGVDREFRPQEELAADRHRGLVSFADAPGGLPHGLGHGRSISGAGHHGPFALELGLIFFDGLIVFSRSRGHRHGCEADQNCSG